MKIGIDRIVLKAIDIDNIDIKAMERNFVIMQDNNKHSFRFMKSKEGQTLYINYIKLSNGFKGLNDIKIGAKQVNNLIIPYEFLDATLPSVIDDKELNVNNISDVESFINSLEVLENRLKCLGLGEINLKNAHIEEIEININIPLDHTFNSYEKTLKYIKELLPKTYKKDQEYRDRKTGEFTGFKCHNTKQSLKVYNKTLQTLEEHKEVIQRDLMRIEYSLLDGRKIKDVFGHNEVDKLIKDFDRVQSVFIKLLDKDILSKINKRMAEDIKVSTKGIKKAMEQDKQNYIKRYMVIYQNELFDYEILSRAIDGLGLKSSNKSLRKKQVRALIEQIEVETGARYFGNIERLEEIIRKTNKDRAIV